MFAGAWDYNWRWKDGSKRRLKERFKAERTTGSKGAEMGISKSPSSHTKPPPRHRQLYPFLSRG